MLFKRFKYIWSVDFEFRCPEGELPEIRCMVAREFYSKKTIKLWRDQLGPVPPFDCYSDNTVLVAYMSAAEMGCFFQLGWKIPTHIIDPYVEFLRITNGVPVEGKGLLNCMAYFGLPGIDAKDKEMLRNLAMEDRRSQQYSSDEKKALIDYCETDVDACDKLLPRIESKMLPTEMILNQALLRGRYMASIAWIMRCGIPVDPNYKLIEENLKVMKLRLIQDIDINYKVFEGESISQCKFANYLKVRKLNWPRTETGKLSTDAETFDEMGKIIPSLYPLAQLVKTLSGFNSRCLCVGSDGYARAELMPFTSITGRNQPKGAHFPFAWPKWLRSIIKPFEGKGLAYIDFGQQEIALAGWLSKDARILNDYLNGDPYINAAIRAGHAPAGATKNSCKDVRELWKPLMLGIQYGQGAGGIAKKLNTVTLDARDLLYVHKLIYPTYWEWLDNVIDKATLRNLIKTRGGWEYHPKSDLGRCMKLKDGKMQERSIINTLKNWQCQATGAEILRVLCIMAMDKGIKLSAPVHDAIMIETNLSNIDETIAQTQDIMVKAAQYVCSPELILKTDPVKIEYPHRYIDEKGADMWKKVKILLNERGIILND